MAKITETLFSFSVSLCIFEAPVRIFLVSQLWCPLWTNWCIFSFFCSAHVKRAVQQKGPNFCLMLNTISTIHFERLNLHHLPRWFPKFVMTWGRPNLGGTTLHKRNRKGKEIFNISDKGWRIISWIQWSWPHGMSSAGKSSEILFIALSSKS